MEQQLESVANILTSLDNLDHLIQSSRPTDSSPSTTPQEIQSVINEYINGLKQLNEMGNTSNFPISYDLLRFLDGDISNPWLYMHKQLEECEDSALILAKRKKHLQEIQNQIKSINSS